MRKLVMAVALVLSFTAYANDFKQNPGDAVSRDAGRRDGPQVRLVDLYESLIELPLHEQRDQTWGLSSRTKAALWTYNIDRYLSDHPELSLEAQQLLHDGIALVSMPAWFDITPGAFGYELKVEAVTNFKERLHMLPPQTVYEVFIRLGPEPLTLIPSTEAPDAEPKARPGVPRADVYGCTCSGEWECGWFGSQTCVISLACDPVPHCGVFQNQWCYGRCQPN